MSTPSRGAWIEENNTTDSTVKMAVIRYGLMAVAIILAIVSLVTVKSMLSTRSENLEAQQVRIHELENNIATKDAEKVKERQVVVEQATGGLDRSRVDNDQKKIEELMSLVFEWQSMDGYMKNRKEVMDSYNIPQDSTFMVDFMPGEIQGVSRKAPNGDVIYAFDKDLASKLDSVDTYVTDINGDTYSYFAVVQAHTTAEDNTTTQKFYATVFYDVVRDTIVNIEPNTVVGDVTDTGV